MRLTTIGFDADDTLWQNERLFRLTQDRFAALLAEWTDADDLSRRLLDAERRNLGRYGYGVKAFVLSMIETAMDVTADRAPATVLRRIIEAGHDMLDHPIDLLPGTRDCIDALKGRFRLLLITKGDLLDQERKLAQSGLGDLFDGVEIVSDKTAAAYTRIFDAHGHGAEAGLMVGDSMRSDVLPMIAAGGIGVHLRRGVSWALERAEAPDGHPRFHAIDDLCNLPDLIKTLLTDRSLSGG